MRHSPVANQAIDLCSVPLMHAARERSRRKNGHKNAVAVLANKVYIYMKLKVELRKKKTEYLLAVLITSVCIMDWIGLTDRSAQSPRLSRNIYGGHRRSYLIFRYDVAISISYGI